MRFTLHYCAGVLNCDMSRQDFVKNETAPSRWRQTLALGSTMSQELVFSVTIGLWQLQLRDMNVAHYYHVRHATNSSSSYRNTVT